MSIDRISTTAQTAFLLAQIQNAGNQLDKVQEQIASGKNASTYAGFNLQVTIESCALASLVTWLACAMERCSLHWKPLSVMCVNDRHTGTIIGDGIEDQLSIPCCSCGNRPT